MKLRSEYRFLISDTSGGNSNGIIAQQVVASCCYIADHTKVASSNLAGSETPALSSSKENKGGIDELYHRTMSLYAPAFACATPFPAKVALWFLLNP